MHVNEKFKLQLYRGGKMAKAPDMLFGLFENLLRAGERWFNSQEYWLLWWSILGPFPIPVR